MHHPKKLVQCISLRSPPMCPLLNISSKPIRLHVANNNRYFLKPALFRDCKCVLPAIIFLRWISVVHQEQAAKLKVFVSNSIHQHGVTIIVTAVKYIFALLINV